MFMQLDQGVSAVIGAIIGLVGGSLVAGMNYRQKGDELFFKALDYLGGGSQNRNLGISAIELYWGKRRHRNVCVSLLCGSAIYLLRQSKQDKAAHELNNLDRIMSLLLTNKRINESQKISYRNLRKSVEDAINDAPKRTADSRGLNVDLKTLDDWKTKLNSIVR
jgi:hypothetical protein